MQCTWLLLVLALASAAGAATEVRWIETPTHRIKVKTVDGAEVGRWSFPRPKATAAAPGAGATTPSTTRPAARPPGDATLGAWTREADAAMARGDRPQAIHLYRKAVGALQGAAADPLELASVLGKLAHAHVESGQLRAAEPHLLRALALLEAAAARSPTAADLHVDLAHVYAAEAQHDQAEGHLMTALAAREAFHGPVHPAVANIVYLLALVRHERGDLGQAEELYRKAITTFREAGAPDHPASLRAHRFYARLLREQGRQYEAKGYEARAQELTRQAP